MAFEEKHEVSPSVYVLDTICDIFNFTDMISIFFVPITNIEGKKRIVLFLIGEFVFNRKKVALNYIRRWFFVDLISNIPYTVIKIIP
jgi:hypothetical protein